MWFCSGGCGRTGTYIAISILLERLKTEGVVDVFQTVRRLRLQRPEMVASVVSHMGYSGLVVWQLSVQYIQSPLLQEQYKFCYKTLMEFLDSFELYANFK